MRISPRSAALAALVLVPACSVTPGFDAPRLTLAERFSNAPASAAPVLLQDTAWWRSFQDPVLDALVEAALSGNLDLEIARERVTEAQALARTLQGGLSTSGEVSAQGRGGSNRPREAGVEVSGGLSWLFDPWGGRAAERAAAQARVQAADAERDAAQLLLLSNLATTYVELRFAEASLQARQRELQARRRNLGLVRQLIAVGSSTQLELVRAQAQLAETEGRIPPLQAAVQGRTGEIAVLLGQAPGASRLPPGRVGHQPVSKLAPEVGIPADLVRNRPDIRINERLYYAAIQDIGDARADLYPSLSLAGTLSLSVFNATEQNAYSFGPALTLPALPNGPRRAAVELRESQARQAHTRWKASVIGAIGEVEAALSEYASAGAAVQAAERSVGLYGRSVALTRELIAGEGATVRELLSAQDDLAAARIRLAEAQRSRARAFVALNVALGSGNRFGADLGG